MLKSLTQLRFTCSKLKLETPEDQCVKSVQSSEAYSSRTFYLALAVNEFEWVLNMPLKLRIKKPENNVAHVVVLP